MDPSASDDQNLIIESSARLMDQLCPLTQVRASAYRDAEFALTYRRRASELGWFSMLVPEELGGGSVSGNGVLDAALIAFERGRRLQPAPFVGVNVVAYALARAGSPDQKAKVLPGLTSGEASAAWLPLPTAPGQGICATRTTSGYRFSGRSTLVQDADSAAWLLIAAETDTGVVQALVDPTSAGLTVTPLDSLDITRHFAEVALDELEVLEGALVGEGGATTGGGVCAHHGGVGRGDGPRLRDDPPVRQGSHRLRPSHRFLPGHQAPAGGHEPDARDE
jgi:alkylation response protein AidB-like acyl-CoA dehydrogenase